MHEWMVGQTDGQTAGSTYGRTDERTHGRTVGLSEGSILREHDQCKPDWPSLHILILKKWETSLCKSECN